MQIKSSQIGGLRVKETVSLPIVAKMSRTQKTEKWATRNELDSGKVKIEIGMHLEWFQAEVIGERKPISTKWILTKGEWLTARPKIKIWTAAMLRSFCAVRCAVCVWESECAIFSLSLLVNAFSRCWTINSNDDDDDDSHTIQSRTYGAWRAGNEKNERERGTEAENKK